ncbi:MAG: hypothetical protein A3G18_06655 [Rhodospirillales bacterium RIFCSPLOWO2_12_FULL_58_28]|nr:MAG: hypothetical protein A3H92_06310 [Rhodospirillales bacterium RIFCSPLOWO2_02_FULL_58_16]OHC79383.1 MAG: hypothetical protein A3G18_06655 [Rhodospirillales bacterium RIFCSPLOWO2_12_FULL_58_28]
MTNALSPEHMKTQELIDEATGILAAGFLRLRARKSSALSADGGESLLDFPVQRSMHGTDKKLTGERT